MAIKEVVDMKEYIDIILKIYLVILEIKIFKLDDLVIGIITQVVLGERLTINELINELRK